MRKKLVRQILMRLLTRGKFPWIMRVFSNFLFAFPFFINSSFFLFCFLFPPFFFLFPFLSFPTFFSFYSSEFRKFSTSYLLVLVKIFVKTLNFEVIYFEDKHDKKTTRKPFKIPFDKNAMRANNNVVLTCVS